MASEISNQSLYTTEFVTKQVRVYIPKETLRAMGVSLEGLQERLQATLNAMTPEERVRIMSEALRNADSRN